MERPITKQTQYRLKKYYLERTSTVGFDGLPRPALSTNNPLNPYLADQAARADRIKRPSVAKPDSDEKVTSVYQELPRYDTDPDEDSHEHLSEEEYEQVMLFARMRGMMNLAFEQGERYQFHVNPASGLVDVICESSGEVMLSLTPLELMEMGQRIHRYAGVLTDKSV